MKKLLMSIFTFSLVLILTLSSFQLESASAISIGNTSDLIEPFTSDLIEPLGHDDDLRFCSGIFNSSDGRSYVTIQTNTSSVDRSIQWGLFIRPSFYDLFRPNVRVTMSTASVNDVRINVPYSSHYESPDYNFHGSMKIYQVSGKNYGLKSGDIVKFSWSVLNPTTINGVQNTTFPSLECVVD